mgnify:CR=1 FL=1
MKDVLGAFNQLQKAYRKYCYQAVAPLGIKMSEMLCVLYLYNFPDEDTACHRTVFPAFGGDGEQKSRKPAGSRLYLLPKG